MLINYLFLPSELLSRFLPVDFGKFTTAWKSVPSKLNEYWSCLILVSARDVTQKARSAPIEEHEKDSLLLFLNQSFAMHISQTQRTRNNMILRFCFKINFVPGKPCSRKKAPIGTNQEMIIKWMQSFLTVYPKRQDQSMVGPTRQQGL